MSDPLLTALEPAGVTLIDTAARHYPHASRDRSLDAAPLYAAYSDLLFAGQLTVWFEGAPFYMADARARLVETLRTFDPIRLRIAIRGLCAMPDIVPASPWSPVAAALGGELEEAWSAAMAAEVGEIRASTGRSQL